MMDDRKQRIGEFAADNALPWAVAALGPVPEDPAARQEWQHKASSIGAYRETYGYHHPADPIGPEPTHDAPDQRAAWHEAFLALGPADGPDVRGMPDGRLWLIRDTYTAETQWAPRHVGRELRLVRLGAHNAELNATLQHAEAQAARKNNDHDRAARHEHWAASYQAMRDHYRQPRRHLRQDHGRPPRVGTSHPALPPPRHRRRRRTTPTPPQPADRAPAIRRTRDRQRRASARTWS